MSKVQAWRFLVSRNQYLDYRTVVAPDFMCQVNIASLLAKTAEGDPLSEDQAYYREIHGSKCGDLTIVYQIRGAQARDVNETAEGILKDSFGREIYLVEGVLLRGIQASIVLTNNDLHSSHERLVEDYCKFWEWVSPQPTIPSEATLLGLSGQPLSYKQVNEYVIGPTSPKSEKTIQSDSSQAPQASSMQSFSLNGEIHLVGFLDNSRILVYQRDRMVYLLNLETNSSKPLIRGGMHRYIRNVSIGLKSQMVCTANVVSGFPDRNLIKVLDLNNLEERDLREGSPSESGRINVIALSHDNSVIAVFERSTISLPLSRSSIPIKLIDIKSGGIRGGELIWHASYVKCIVASPLDNLFASGDRQGCVKLWNWKTSKCVGSMFNHDCTVNAIAFSPCEKVMVTGSEDGRISITSYKNDIEEKGALGENAGDWIGGVNALAFSPNGKIVASGGDDGKVKLWDVKNKLLASELSGHDRPVMSVGFSPDGKLLASGSKDFNVRIWRLG
jgi:WD40 repeat protein